MNNLHYLGFGTNKYPSLGESATLQQCESDVLKLSKTVEMLGFSQETFIAEQTTKQNIAKIIISRLISLESLADETGKLSLLVIHKSSHGSQQPEQKDDPQDEPDHADECWVCYDTVWNTQENKWDNVLVDDELVTILKGVDPKKCLVIVVSDTCNSGTFTRALCPQIIQNRRFVFPRNKKTYILNKLADKVKNGRRKKAAATQYWVEIPEVNWCLIAGANADSFSYETSAGGVLTSTIIEYIRDNRKDLGSTKTAAQEIAQNARNKNSQQYAHFECAVWFLNKCFFGTDDYPQVEPKPRKCGLFCKLWNKIAFWK